MSRNSKKQSILCIIKNNFWILKLIKIYAPSLIVDQVIRVPVSVLGTFVSINFTRWIIDFVDQQYSFKRIVYLIIAIFSFFIITNLLYAISSIILIPQKQINLSAKIRENVIKKVSRINQIEFQKSDFFNIYTLGLNEIDSRPYKVLTTLFSAITSVISIFVVTGVTVGISAGFSILGIIAAVTDAGFGVIRQKYNYKQTIETTPDGRKRGYINRITYQPEFAEDLKVYPEFLNLLLERYRKATQSVKKIILKFSKKILLIDQFQQIPGLIFRQILPWVCIAYLLINKSITVSQATVLASTALTIPRLLVTLMSSASSFYEHSLYIDNLRNILNYKEDIERKSDKQIALKTPINFNIDDISFSYEEKEVLTHISLKITCGEKIAIVGYNGAGKSTLVKLLVRLYDVDNGEIFINDDFPEIGRAHV